MQHGMEAGQRLYRSGGGGGQFRVTVRVSGVEGPSEDQ